VTIERRERSLAGLRGDVDASKSATRGTNRLWKYAMHCEVTMGQGRAVNQAVPKMRMLEKSWCQSYSIQAQSLIDLILDL